MKKLFLKFLSYGKMSVEKCEGVNPYLVREIMLEELDEFPVNRFFGTVCDKDAMLDLHRGDLVVVDISFWVRQSGEKSQQELYFSNIKKINSLQDLALW